MAEALVGGALLSAFLRVAFDRLASPDILGFFRKRKLNEDLLKKLKTMLLFINAVVDDAEQQQIANPHVRAWLDELKDALYDAEDVLDDIDYELTKRKVEAQLPTPTISKVRNFFTASVSSSEKKIESRMAKVLENIEYLATQKDILKLKEVRGGAGFRRIMPERLPTTSLVDEAGTYGRDDDKEIIIEWLLSDNYNSSQPSIISIVGMGGLGKTTLAQLVFNDQRVKDIFDVKAWVCVSDDFDVMTITRKIIEEITMSKDSSTELNMLQIKLKQLLTQKRFLLILDDVWNENYMLWEALQSPFNHGAFGSKILVTTRSVIVASTMRTTNVHYLKQLSEEESWSLFRRYAFHNEDAAHSNSRLEEIGRKIIERCKGLPLALKTIGSLLYKLSIDEWTGILKSQVWKEKNNVLPALRLSYNYLPSFLKRCFAYCSIFPKDYEFDKEDLIQLWMAENFLPIAHQSEDIREVGEQFFHDLLSRSLFQQSTGETTRFVMHDLINDLAKDVSRKFCHRLDIDEVNNLTKITRHVSFFRSHFDHGKRFENIYPAGRLRTFWSLFSGYPGTFISSKMRHDLLLKFKCLRVLSFAGYKAISTLPDSIGSLRHLRYLDLTYTNVERLPDSICELYHLQTLKLWHCNHLEELPSNLYKFINLRHLDFRETIVRKMPKLFEKLKHLQVLSMFYVEKCSGTNIKQLKELNLRGTISILELQNVVDSRDALAINLKSKIYLEELILGWNMDNGGRWNDKDVLERLQPHQNLKKLSIRNYGDMVFSDWFANCSLSNIVSLELRNCQYCLSIPSLGLPSLKCLRFQGMDRWEEWKYENMSGAFPRLQELYIEDCPKLKEHLPTQLPSLKKLVIDGCMQLVASISSTPSLHELVLRNCEMLQLECVPSTLKVLHINGCLPEIFSVEKIENSIADTSIEKLKIFNYGKLELPLCHCYNFLLKLKIKRSCDSLISFSLDLFPKLQSLKLIECSNLEKISILEGKHDSLTKFTIKRCPKFVSFPTGGFSAPKLKVFHVSELESLESFPEGGLPSNLAFLHVRKCPKLIASRMDWDLHSHPSLVIFIIEEDTHVESFPDAGLLPPTLTGLSISSCPNLRMLEHSLCHFSALETLLLLNCPKLQHLPKEGLPKSLSTLRIWDCPMLKKCFQKQKGKDWAKIAHIPCVDIDYDIVT